jgi:hypothetical protein
MGHEVDQHIRRGVREAHPAEEIIEGEFFRGHSVKFTPSKEKLTEILREFEPNRELADAIEKASKEMRQAQVREVDFDADT